MRLTQKCPKCEGRRFLVQPIFKLADHDSSNSVEDFPVVALENGWSKRTELGHFEAWTCLGCGLSEFYAQLDMPLVEELARTRKELKIVDASPPSAGPHR